MVKKKLKTNPDGTLSYPHSFKIGDLVEIGDKIHLLKGAYGNGVGIITFIDNEVLKVYWQANEKYMDYSIASAVLALKVLT
jgi:hypothetical protein